MTDLSSVVSWLVDGARSARSPQETLAQLCTRLIDCGVGLDRVVVFVQTLHPNIMGRSFAWRPGHEVEVNEAPIALMGSERYRKSPVAQVTASGQPLRRPIQKGASSLDFPILEDLSKEGFTDFLCSPLHFANGEVHAVTWATMAAGGFRDRDLASIASVLGPLARVAEIWALRRVAANLLNTYVGRQSGARILAGHIQRGDTDEIEAAIWLSDLRGFTARSEQLPSGEVIALLNRFFDCQMPAITEHGGEVLKFIGDGLLAIFPVPEGGSVSDACISALGATRAAVAELGRAASDLRYGIALHVGKVAYGNIGGTDRLDFTCIGPAINMTARLEKLSGEVQRAVLASGAFAANAPQSFEHLGNFPLKGFGTEQSVYSLT